MSETTPPPTTSPCVIPNCNENARWKGLCGKCYHQANALIKENKTTWEELASLGLASVPESPFIVAYRAKKTEPPQ